MGLETSLGMFIILVFSLSTNISQNSLSSAAYDPPSPPHHLKTA